MKETPILAVVTERDMDLLILEELHVSESFSTWFAQETFGKQVGPVRLRDAWHSISDPSLGESDLLVLYTSADDSVLAVLVENKVDAPPQPNQARRYAERGRVGVERGDWHRFTTAIVAPNRYLARGGDVAEFAARVSYESISDWLGRNLPDRARAGYKANLLRMAIEQSRRGPTPRVDERVTTFYRQYWECARREFPELAMKEPVEKTANSNWVGFHPKDLGRNRQIYHKMDIGRVDLEISGAAGMVDQLRTSCASYLAPDTTIEKAGKSAAVRIPVPVLDTLAPFEEQMDKARAGMRAAYRLYYHSRLIGGA